MLSTARQALIHTSQPFEGMTDKEFLMWIYYRLQIVHHEKTRVDYMLRLARIITEMNPYKTTAMRLIKKATRILGGWSPREGGGKMLPPAPPETHEAKRKRKPIISDYQTANTGKPMMRGHRATTTQDLNDSDSSACSQCSKLQHEIDAITAALSCPTAVHINTLRGTIAKMSDSNVRHIYPHLFDGVES